MGGASSFYAMLAIAAFLVVLWIAGRISRLIGVSSIVLEVAVGITLGPSVLNLIPTELTKCRSYEKTNCWDYDELTKVAQKGYKYCDLGEYLKKDKYVLAGQPWYAGFWGELDEVTLKTKDDKPKKTYCLNPNSNSPGCQKHRRLEELEPVPEEDQSISLRETSWMSPSRRLGGDNEGKDEYDTYFKCLVNGCELKVSLECATVPDVFTLVGHTGVAVMIFESGMHFDFEQAKTVGPWACAVAVLGTFLPLITGVLLSWAFGFDIMPDGLSAGVSLAPTSVGIALKLLHEAKALQTYFGQAVMTAAFVDDVLSLILFSVLFSLGGDITFMAFVPLILGCVFMVLAIVGAVTVWPMFMKWFFSVVPEYKPDAKVTNHDEAMWILMFLTLCAYAQITHLCGTHLWGCFIAGMSFATNHHCHHVWVKQVKRLTCWWLRIFFGCTLAWSIPVNELFSITAFWKGTLMGIGPCILTKVCCGPFMGRSRWVIGWAMVGRAEFAYFIAILSKSLNMMNEKLFAILVWALIYATIFAPLIFRKVLARYMKRETGEAPEAPDPNRASLSGTSDTGHLPDFEGEQKEKEELEQQERIGSKTILLETQLSAKNEEIRQLKKQLEEDAAPLYEANLTVPQPAAEPAPEMNPQEGSTLRGARRDQICAI